MWSVISEHLRGKHSSPPAPSRALIFWIDILQGSAEGLACFKAYDQSHENQWCLKLIPVSSSLLNQVLSQGFVSSNSSADLHYHSVSGNKKWLLSKDNDRPHKVKFKVQTTECKKATHRRMWPGINEVKTTFELVHEHKPNFIFFSRAFNPKSTVLL